jgi:hypothetical protein
MGTRRDRIEFWLSRKGRFWVSNLKYRLLRSPSGYLCFIAEVVPEASDLGDGWQRECDSFSANVRRTAKVETPEELRDISQFIFELGAPSMRDAGVMSMADYMYSKQAAGRASALDLHISQFIDPAHCAMWWEASLPLFRQGSMREVGPRRVLGPDQTSTYLVEGPFFAKLVSVNAASVADRLLELLQERMEACLRMANDAGGGPGSNQSQRHDLSVKPKGGICMGVTYGVYPVDWSTFVRRWKENRNLGFLREALDNLGEQDSPEWLTWYDDADWCDVWSAAIRFSEAFKHITKDEPPKLVEPFRSLFLRAGIIANDDYHWSAPMDIDSEIGELEPGWFFSAISPDTITEFLSAWSSLDIGQLARLYEKHIKDDEIDIKDSRWFRGYPEMWFDLFSKVHAQGKGLLITLA